MLITGAVVIVIDVGILQPVTHSAQGAHLVEAHLVGMAGIPADAHHGIIVAVYQTDQLLIAGTVPVGPGAVQAGQHIFKGRAHTVLNTQFYKLIVVLTVLLQLRLLLKVILREAHGMGGSVTHAQHSAADIGSAHTLIKVLRIAGVFEVGIGAVHGIGDIRQMALGKSNTQLGCQIGDAVDALLPVVIAKDIVGIVVAYKGKVKDTVACVIQAADRLLVII